MVEPAELIVLDLSCNYNFLIHFGTFLTCLNSEVIDRRCHLVYDHLRSITTL